MQGSGHAKDIELPVDELWGCELVIMGRKVKRISYPLPCSRCCKTRFAFLRIWIHTHLAINTNSGKEIVDASPGVFSVNSEELGALAYLRRST